MEFGFEPVCDQLRTSFEPDSVMEFGFNEKELNSMELDRKLTAPRYIEIGEMSLAARTKYVGL